MFAEVRSAMSSLELELYRRAVPQYHSGVVDTLTPENNSSVFEVNMAIVAHYCLREPSGTVPRPAI